MLLSYFALFLLNWTAYGGPAPGYESSESNSLKTVAGGNSPLKQGYVVVLKEDTEVDRVIGSLDRAIVDGIGHKYTKALKGFSGKFDALQLSLIRALPALKYIEEDIEVYAHIKEINAPYGLAITSGKGKLAPAKQKTYYYNPSNSTTTVYVIDTGIDITHPEFQGRASFARDFTGEGKFDGEGHGTHVAGTVGSKTYGVYKRAKLVAVKVLDSTGSGTLSGIIAGLDWVSNNHDKRSVINMSLGTNSPSQSQNDAARGAYDSGVTVVVSAGNSGEYGMGACDLSPASEPSAITVGCINKVYKAVPFSSEDGCVDIHAPGVNVLSLKPGNKTQKLSGTSMSSPHVAGVAAYLISQTGVYNPPDVTKMVLQYSQKGLLTNLRGAPNKLVNNGFFES